MLELLELQARARAIRSQLALEPVTKIELDDSDTESSAPAKEKEANKNVETATLPPLKDSSQKKKNSSPKHSDEQSKMPATRPVRLKRNFRQRQTDGYDSDENQLIGEVESEKTNATVEDAQSSENPLEKEQSPEKQESPSKEADKPPMANDDDVVPIIAEPEVLCISSSDSESDDKSTSSKVKKYINMPVVEKVDRPPTEDELFLLKIKEKSEAKLKSDVVVLNKDAKTTERTTDDVQNVEKEIDIEHATDELEMEDGEIVEDDEIVEIAESPEQVEEKAETSETVAETNDEIPEQSEKQTDKSQDKDESITSGSEEESDDEKKSSDSADSGSDSGSSERNNRSLASRNSKKSNVDDDDDDIIDLGKDVDLDFEQLEMSTVSEVPEKVKSPRRSTRSKTRSGKSADREKSAEPKVNHLVFGKFNIQFITYSNLFVSYSGFLHFKSLQDESWDKRWLRGNKVSKVLQVSKLANKVRSKIIEKKSKTATKCQPAETEAPKEPEPAVPPNVELGSVEHYKELTKQK